MVAGQALEYSDREMDKEHEADWISPSSDSGQAESGEAAMKWFMLRPDTVAPRVKSRPHLLSGISHRCARMFTNLVRSVRLRAGRYGGTGGTMRHEGSPL